MIHACDRWSANTDTKCIFIIWSGSSTKMLSYQWQAGVDFVVVTFDSLALAAVIDGQSVTADEPSR